MSEPMPFEALREHEVLWAINRTLFHPRGYALGLSYPSKDVEAINRHEIEPDGWTLYGDGTEPWQYGDSVDEDAAFAVFNAFLAKTAAEGAQA